jgi:hypothetical protein
MGEEEARLLRKLEALKLPLRQKARIPHPHLMSMELI